MHSTNTRVIALEAKCSKCEATVVDLHLGLTELDQKHQKDVTDLRDKLDEYENRQRRKNLRIVGFPLGVEGDNAVGFLEKRRSRDPGTHGLSRDRESPPHATETSCQTGGSRSLRSQTPALQRCDPDPGSFPQEERAPLRQFQNYDLP